MDEKERRALLTDKWNGFADLLANLIEKYAAVLDIDNLPEMCIRDRWSVVHSTTTDTPV